MFHMNDMKVSSRLRLLVASVILGLTVIAAVSYFTIEKVRIGGPIDSEITLYHDLNAEITPASLEIEQVRYTVLLMLVDNANKEQLPRDIALFQERKKAYLDANEQWSKKIPDGKVKDLICVQSYQMAMQYFDTVEHEIIPALNRGNLKEAMAGRERAAALVTKASELTKLADQLTDAQEAELDRNATKTAETRTIAMIIVAVVVGLLIAFLGLAIGRGVAQGTGSAVNLAKAIAVGDLKKTEVDLGQNEFGDLLTAMNQSIDSIKGLLGEMDNMSSQHDLGEIDVFVRADNFKGAYQTMASGLNHMVQGHILVKKKAMACIAEFGKGNFDAPLERFPGKKAFINENIEGLRTNLKQVSSETGELIEATLQGKLDNPRPRRRLLRRLEETGGQHQRAD